MIDKSIIELLGKVAPDRLQDLFAALDLVSSEIKYAQDAVDAASKSAITDSRYDEVSQLVNVSKMLKSYVETINSFLDEYSSKDGKDEENTYENEEVIRQGERRDYSAYDVDDKVAYDLFTHVTYKRPAAFRFKGHKYQVQTWSGMLTAVCGLLCKENKAIFASFPDDKSMQGKRSMRFSTSKANLRVGVLIRNSGVYVETNLSANEVRKTILAMLDKYGISSDEMRIYFRRDLTPLHK